MKSSWFPHSHHFSWRKSWRSPTVTADQWARHGATLGVPTLKEPGEVKITKCPSCGGPQPAGHRGRPWQGLHMLLERNHDWLVVIPLFLWKMMEWVTVGMMTFPTEWKNKSHVPNRQPDDFGALGKSSTKHWWKSLAGRPLSELCRDWAQFQAELNVKYLAASSQSIDWNKVRELQLYNL